MNEAMDPSILVFGLLAVFVVWKLYSILGTNSSPSNRSNAASSAASATSDFPSSLEDAPLPKIQNSQPAVRWAGIVAEGSPLSEAFDRIQKQDPNFDPKEFLAGACQAYEWIVVAFAKADLTILQSLLAPSVFQSFSAEISARKARHQTSESVFVALDQFKILDAQLTGSIAHITVQFESQLIHATRDAAGAIVGGDPEKIVSHIDVWTFARNVSSTDPNWKLVATQAPV